MTNLERATAILERHREARRWTDVAAAGDMLAAFGIDPAGDIEAPHPGSDGDGHSTDGDGEKPSFLPPDHPSEGASIT